MNWLISNLSTIIISLVLILLFSSIIYFQIRNRRKGKNSCGCGCSGCTLSETCHKNKETSR